MTDTLLQTISEQLNTITDAIHQTAWYVALATALLIAAVVLGVLRRG